MVSDLVGEWVEWTEAPRGMGGPRTRRGKVRAVYVGLGLGPQLLIEAGDELVEAYATGAKIVEAPK